MMGMIHLLDLFLGVILGFGLSCLAHAASDNDIHMDDKEDDNDENRL